MLSKKQFFSYILLSFPLAFIGLPIYIYLPNFYDQNFNITLQEIATILLLTRFSDATLDPIIGILSDKYKHLRKRIIYISCPLLGISVLLLFSPQFHFFGIKISLAIFLFLTYFLFSLIWINHQSLAVSFTKDYNLKTKIIAFRESIFIFGIIFASIFPFLLATKFSPVKSFEIMGFFYLFLICFCGLIFAVFTKNNIKIKEKTSFNFAIFRLKKLQKFFVVFFFNSVASSIPASLITFFVIKVLNLENYIGLFLIIYFCGLIFGIIFWSFLSKKLNNKLKAWLISSIATILVFPFCFFLGEGDLVFYALICLISGFTFGGDFSLSYSVLTDIIQEKKLEKNESTIFASTNFIIKISFTILSASLIYFIGEIREIGAFNFEKTFLSYSYSLLPCFFKIISSIYLFKLFKNYENF